MPIAVAARPDATTSAASMPARTPLPLPPPPPELGSRVSPGIVPRFGGVAASTMFTRVCVATAVVGVAGVRVIVTTVDVGTGVDVPGGGVAEPGVAVAVGVFVAVTLPVGVEDAPATVVLVAVGVIVAAAVGVSVAP